MWAIISCTIIAFTIGIIKDTNVKEYYSDYKLEFIDEYNVEIPLWVCLCIILFGFIPIINLILFLGFIIYWVTHAVWTPYHKESIIHVFSLRGTNIITKCLLRAKDILCKKI